MSGADTRPIVTGATGNLGRSVAAALATSYRIVGFDREAHDIGFPVHQIDFTADASIALALRTCCDAYGSRIASVVHLAAYFDFTGEDYPLYQLVNVESTRRVVRAERQPFPSVILRLAEVYDEHPMVLTLAQQMARVYERDLQSHLYSGNPLVGQSALHRDDTLEAQRRCVDQRAVLPPDAVQASDRE